MTASIGVDIGGTNTCIGVVTPDGVVHDRAQFRTDEYTSGAAFADRLAEVVRGLMTSHMAKAVRCDWAGLVTS